MISRVGQPVSLLCGSVWGEGSERGQCCCLASGGFPGRKLSPSTCPFSSPYATCALPAVALVLKPRGGGSAWVPSLCGPFKRSLLIIWQFLPLPQPHWFLQPEAIGIYLSGTGSLVVWVVWFVAGIPPEVSLPTFIHPTWMWDCLLCCLVLPPLCTIPAAARLSMPFHLSPCLCPSFPSVWMWFL